MSLASRTPSLLVQMYPSPTAHTLAGLTCAVLIALAAPGCGASSPTAPSTNVAAQAPTTPPTTPTSVTTPTATSALTVEQMEMLSGAIQDEYHAQAVYQGVLGDLGQVLPFANIVLAEQAHAASVARLYANRGLAAPATAWSVSNVPHFRTIAEACGAAAAAEVANIALYDRYLATDLPLDVRNVFTNNRAASVNGHLPAFNRCK